jgi:hypothetical protein
MIPTTVRTAGSLILVTIGTIMSVAPNTRSGSGQPFMQSPASEITRRTMGKTASQTITVFFKRSNIACRTHAIARLIRYPTR